jgi:hypothetical protein
MLKDNHHTSKLEMIFKSTGTQAISTKMNLRITNNNGAKTCGRETRKKLKSGKMLQIHQLIKKTNGMINYIPNTE